MRLPEGKDPDQVIREDPEAWRAAAAQPQPIMEYLIDTYAARFDTRTIQGRERLVAAILPTLRSVSDPVRRDGYLQLLSRRSGVEERVLLESLRQPGWGPAFRASRGLPARAGERQTAPMPVVGSTSMPSSPAQAPSTRWPSNARWSRSSRRSCGSSWSTPRASSASRSAAGRGHGHHPGPRAVAGNAGRPRRRPDGDFKRDRFLSSLDPTLEALARTLYARADPEPETEEALDQSVEQCLMRLSAGA